jgi:patatin-related protein
MTRVRLHEDDREDIRLAVVMNGGVSLAVWIGGVTREINRVANARPGSDDPSGVYDGLLDLVQGRARVDVISGTSAGGINGAFLALAAAHGRDLEPLGPLWAERGAVADLLRLPGAKSPSSLMRGDHYFLPALADAFRQVFPPDPTSSARSSHDAPVDLTITTSILSGEARVFHDDFGTPIAEVDHSGTFRFRRTSSTDPKDDPFAQKRVVAQLALASRCTASFPFAFEASWCPVNAEAGEAGSIDALHPDMAGIADFDHSHYVVDGGLLLNKPLVPALQSIRSMPARHQVRRILCYVNPDPGDQGMTPRVDDRATSPRLASTVIDSVFTLPLAQSIDAALDDIQQRNARAKDRKESSLELVAGLGSHADVLADQLFETYRLIRRRRAFATVADRVMPVRARQTPAAGPATPDRPAWTRDEIIAALDAVDDLPFVPQAVLHDALDVDADWRWGVAPVERLGYLTVDVLRRAMWVTPVGDEQAPDPIRTKLLALRGRLHAVLGHLRALRQEDTAFWQARALPDPPEETADRPDVLRGWAANACAAWPAAEAGTAALRTAHELAGILVETRSVCGQLPAEPPGPWAVADRLLLDRVLTALVPGPTVESCLRRLLTTEVATFATGVSRDEVDQVVDLIQISGNGTNSFGASESAAKLAGVKLGHFAAFYKKSWRVNDFVWGRLDGATRLVRAVLAPARLRQLGYTTDQALEEIAALAIGPDGDADAAALRERFERQRCRDELTFLSEHSHPMPPSLPACAMAVARRLHLQILREHLPELELAVTHDEAEGAADPSNGTRFRAAYRHATRDGREPSADEVFALFRDARIGEETVQHDVGSALFARTVSTAAAVTASTLAGEGNDVKVLRALGRAVRGVAMLLYAMVRGTAMGGTSAALVTVALGVGGAFVAVFLLTRTTPAVVPVVGVMVLLAGLALASLRSRLRKQGWFLLVGVVVTLAAGVARVWLAPSLDAGVRALVDNVLVVVGVVALALGAMALGGLEEVRRTSEPAPGGRPPRRRRPPPADVDGPRG